MIVMMKDFSQQYETLLHYELLLHYERLCEALHVTHYYIITLCKNLLLRYALSILLHYELIITL